MIPNIPRPRLFGARQILKDRDISAPLRAYARWDNDTQTFTSWNEEVLGVEPTVEELESAYITAVKGFYIEELAKKRYETEIGGVMAFGVPVKTDRSSQMLLNGAMSYVGKKPSVVIKWKSSAGFVELNASQIHAIAEAVGDHVQACFQRESEILDNVLVATTIEDLESLKDDIENFAY